jgi:hypothetical protein
MVTDVIQISELFLIMFSVEISVIHFPLTINLLRHLFFNKCESTLKIQHDAMET